MMRTQDAVIDEICSVQRTYVRDLKTLVTLYLLPSVPYVDLWLRKGENTSKAPEKRIQSVCMFSVFLTAARELIRFHSSSLQQLEAAKKQQSKDAAFSIEEGLVTFFNNAAEQRNNLSVYLNRADKMREFSNHLKQCSEDYSKMFGYATQKAPEISFVALLMLPFRVFVNYQLLLERFIKNSGVENAFFHDLEVCRLSLSYDASDLLHLALVCLHLSSNTIPHSLR